MKVGDLVKLKDIFGFKGILLCRGVVPDTEEQLKLFDWTGWKVLWFEHPYEKTPYVATHGAQSLRVYCDENED
tara:strand:+ start:2965 stop:3183 length:219 start_codon:yes stop_codon:yes gene_type:complete